MLEYWENEDYIMKKQKMLPVSARDFASVDCAEELLEKNGMCFVFG